MRGCVILKRIPGSRYSEVLRAWEGETAVLIAGGPSLTLGQVAMVKDAGVRVIAVNDAFLLAPWADVCYFADAKWWRWTTDGTPKPGFTAEDVRECFRVFAGQKCSIQSSAAAIEDDAVHMLRNRNYPNHGQGISLDPGALVTGKNGGFQALNLAILAGVSTAILIGYDGAPMDGKRHWFGDHPRESDSMGIYAEIRKSFALSTKEIEAAGVRVVNCSPGTSIDAFHMADLADALAMEAMA